MHSSWGPLLVTAFQWGGVCPEQAVMWQAQEELGRGVGQSRGGTSQAASYPAGGTSHRAGPAQPVSSANLATAKQKTGSQPGSWLWGWELWEEGPGPTGGNL